MIRNTAQRLALTVLMLTLAFLLAALPYATASAQSPPSPPTVLGGTAWLDGQLVPPGTLIQAMQDSTQLSRITARTNGRFGPLQVSKPPGAGPVYFLVNGQRADIEMHWRAGFLQADLELRAGLGAQPAPAATATPRPAPTARPEQLAAPTAVVVAGPRGERGPAGAQGPIGPAGPRGEPGQSGPDGLRGERGPEGEEGPRGRKGETSDYGLYTLGAAGVASLLALAALIVAIVALSGRSRPATAIVPPARTQTVPAPPEEDPA